MFMYDNGELFWIEGGNVALARWGSREEWARIPSDRKLETLGLSCKAFNTFFGLPKYCNESVLPDEPQVTIANAVLHHECGVRMAVGSVGHQLGACPHHGKVDASEDGKTLRQGARAASSTTGPRIAADFSG